MARAMKRARYLFCPKGSHLAMYDDQETYMKGIIQFIEDVEAERF
jgi:proline iminopeptidase